MKTFTYLQEQIVKAMVYAPNELFRVIREAKNPQYASAFAARLIPYRFGIEIDSCGWDKNLRNNSRLINATKAITAYDAGISINSNDDYTDRQHNEIRISGCKYNHLKPIKYILDTFQANPKCVLPSNGGLHIHIDMGKDNHADYQNVGADKFEKKFHFKEKINRYAFFINNKVTNGRKFGRDDSQRFKRESYVGYNSGGEIIMFRHLPTIEFRIMHSTFDYATIVKAVLCFSLITKCIREKYEFNKDFASAILAV